MHFHSRACVASATVLLAFGLFLTAGSRAADTISTAGATGTVVPAGGPEQSAIENSVVKVFSTVRAPDLYKPWTKQSPEDFTGSGVVIEGRRILTNAHVVEHASQVQIQANQAGDKIFATVETIAPDIDLAVLKLDDDKFFDTHPPLPRARALPSVKDMVLAYGYPEGGTSLSITKGIVSRVEFEAYHFPVSGLRIQIDAAINPGNSGGPAVVDGKMIGLTFSHLADADNIGYIIPSEEIDLFLNSIKDGQYQGKPAMFDDLQTLENPALRKFLKLDPSVHGLIVRHPARDESGYPLKMWDVITKIGNYPVDDEGMIKINDQLRLRCQYAVQKIVARGKVPLTIVRHSREMNIELPVSTDYPRLIPSLGNGYPSYFIYGPMVFTEATDEYLAGLVRTRYGASVMMRLSASGSPLASRITDQPKFEGERLAIVAAPFFPHKLSEGYGNPISLVVKSVNGIQIKNLAHLVAVLRDCKDEFVTFEYFGHAAENMVFPRAQMVAATDDILNDNGVRAQGSPELMQIWNAKGR